MHGQPRLAVLFLLASVDDADFKWLRDRTGSPDGNLDANLYRLTPAGRKALATYVAALRKLLGPAL